MRQNSDGTFEADPGENIKFTVTRKVAPCVAGFSGEGWKSCGPVTEPDAKTEVKVCTAPMSVGNRCAMSISVSFTPEPTTGDEYRVTVEGSAGGDHPSPDVFTAPPNINGEVFKFHVSKP